MIRRSKRTGMPASLLDIMCCLVFIFLLTSLLAASTQIEARERMLPPIDLARMQHPSADVMPDTESCTITISPGPVYLLSGKEVTMEQLGAALKDSAPDEIEIRGDQHVAYGEIMKIMQTCREAGTAQIALTYETAE